MWKQSANLTPRAELGRARMPPAGCIGKHCASWGKAGIQGKQTLREVAGGCVSVVICGDAYAGEFGMCECWAIEALRTYRQLAVVS